MTDRVVVEADGGSRGNPGQASYGALVRDADTGRVIAERGESIGRATNNVAEYRGLIAGLELARDHAPGAAVEVRMDSKLVIEQMAGRWKIKHPDMKPLALRARTLVPSGVVWTWVPRASNKAADALANLAMDEENRTGRPAIVGSVPGDGPSDDSIGDRDIDLDSGPGLPADDGDVLAAPAPSEDDADRSSTNPLLGWRGRQHGDPTTVVMLRHGVTQSTLDKLFCGRGGTDPGLVEQGEQQAARAAAWIGRNLQVDAIVSSPLRRTRETAGFVARETGLEVSIDDGFEEAGFGEWDGHSFADIMTRWPDELNRWLGSTAVAPPGGETFDEVYERVRDARDRLLRDHGGQTVVVASHVTPIKMMVRLALDGPMSLIHAMELAPASITTIAWWPDGTPSLRNFSVVPE